MTGSQLRPRPQVDPGALPADRVRGRRPDDDSWRADALAGSRHSRLADELVQPLEQHDFDSSWGVCARVSRQLLGDFAPALMLLSTRERQRAQAVTTYALTLFDFVRQTGLEGERLAAVNRWEFELEQALSGQPAGQPVFVLIAELEKVRAWPRQGFERLHSIARRRCARRRPANRQVAEHEARELGATLAWLFLDEPPSAPLTEAAAAVVRLRALIDLGEDSRRHRARFPASELPDTRDVADPDVRSRLDRLVAAECRRIVPMLRAEAAVAEVPAPQRPALRYVRLAALKLARRLEDLQGRVVETPPRLNLGQRLVLLCRSRWQRF